MKRLKIVLATSTIFLLTSTHVALGQEKNPSILQSIDANLVHELSDQERDSARGEYFDTQGAARVFCAISYPGCKGKISYNYQKGKWQVLSRATNRYLSY